MTRFAILFKHGYPSGTDVIEVSGCLRKDLEWMTEMYLERDRTGEDGEQFHDVLIGTSRPKQFWIMLQAELACVRNFAACSIVICERTNLDESWALLHHFDSATKLDPPPFEP